MITTAAYIYSKALDNASLKSLTLDYTSRAKTEHPDVGGDVELWTLRTAAYNEMKRVLNKKRGKYSTKSDERWAEMWAEAQHRVYTNKAKEAKMTDETVTPEAPEKPKFVFVKQAGETVEDQRRRYAREYAKFRYADPEYAAKRRESSRRSHKKNDSK